MAGNYKAPRASPQTLLARFTAPPTTLHDFRFVKVIDVFLDFSTVLQRIYRQ